MDFRRALEHDRPEEALKQAANYEKMTGTVIDCSDDNVYPYLFRWASCASTSPSLVELYNLIRRGGGVTLQIATRPHHQSAYIGFWSTAIFVAARSLGEGTWLIPMLATQCLRPAWGRPEKGWVPLQAFLLNMITTNSPTVLGSESVALQMLDQTPIEALLPYAGSEDTPPLPGCLEMAVRLGMRALAIELMRRNIGDLPHCLSYVHNTERSKWSDLYEANRSYYTELVPTLQLCFQTIVMPKPLIELVAQFVRGPFQL
jgi:hypothetical protein